MLGDLTWASLPSSPKATRPPYPREDKDDVPTWQNNGCRSQQWKDGHLPGVRALNSVRDSSAWKKGAFGSSSLPTYVTHIDSSWSHSVKWLNSTSLSAARGFLLDCIASLRLCKVNLHLISSLQLQGAIIIVTCIRRHSASRVGKAGPWSSLATRESGWNGKLQGVRNWGGRQWGSTHGLYT